MAVFAIGIEVLYVAELLDAFHLRAGSTSAKTRVRHMDCSLPNNGYLQAVLLSQTPEFIIFPNPGGHSNYSTGHVHY